MLLCFYPKGEFIPAPPTPSCMGWNRRHASVEEKGPPGALKEVGWFTPQEGYAIFESDSKEKVLGMVQPFFPYYDQDIREIVSWENAKEALLGSARRAASR